VTVLDEVVRCPSCRAASPTRNGEAYTCPSCGSRFPIVEGVPRLLDGVPADSTQIERVFDFEHRRFADSRHTRFEPRLVDEFLNDCKLPRDFFVGLRAVDAGCGSGRWTYALVELGAKVVGFDLTPGGVESAQEALGDRGDVAICQANIFEPPLLPGAFDFVMSWGVLHHTPDTRKAFESVAQLVKPGGTLYVMVYERHSPAMFFFTDIVRWFMRRLSDEKRYRACRHLVVKSPRVKGLLGKVLMVSYYDPSSDVDLRTLQFGLYDAYSPRYNHLHSAEEVFAWFEEAGFSDVTVVERGTGAVKIRGRRAG
jgi:SAM-dependent methyltransferase